MQIKSSQYKIRGMNKDLSYSAFNPEYSWHNHNVRLTARDDNDLLSVTNERGNKYINVELQGLCLGTCAIDDKLIVFTHESPNVDRIYKIVYDSVTNSYLTVLLCSLNLGFNTNNKIQTLPFYENESVQKVYWIDGLNQPRFINIQDSTTVYNSSSFDFIQKLSLSENISVTKNYIGGSFKSGIIQYAMTYFNENGAESNIFWISDINYISFEDRAGKVDEIIPNTFKIVANNLEPKYDYVRLYSIHRTSLDSTPELRDIVDLKIPQSGAVSYVDSGNNGSIISTDFLLYVGGEELIPQCISQKNNTLFLGNITLPNNTVIPPTLKTTESGDLVAIGVPLHNSQFTWEYNDVDFEGISEPTGNSMYPYLPFKSNVKHFKFDETYRLGVQGQFSNGKWSNPIWLGEDKKVDKRYSTKYGIDGRVVLSYVTGRYSIDNSLRDYLKKSPQQNGLGFVKIRPVMVPLNYSDRTIVAQGIVSNTLGIVKNRHSGISSAPFSYPDYTLRCGGKAKTLSGYDGKYAHFDLLKLNNASDPKHFVEIMGNGSMTDHHDLSDLYFNEDSNDDFFFVDRNMVNVWSPDIANHSDIISSYIKNVKSVGLYGFAFQTAMNTRLVVDYADIESDNYSISSDFYPNFVPNYSTDKFIESYKRKSLFPLIESISWGDGVRNELYKTYHLFPVWTPAKYNLVSKNPDRGHTEEVIIDFTQFNKSGYNYFGLNRTLNTSYSDYKYNINNPSVLINDESAYYKSNEVDNKENSGYVIYSKNVEKVYPSNTYFNTIQYFGGDTYYSKSVDGTEWPVKNGLSVKYNTAIHALFSFKQKYLFYDCMPRLQNYGESDSFTSEVFDSLPLFYRDGTIGFSVNVIGRDKLNGPLMDVNDKSSENVLPIFDLYSSVTDDTRYGGKTADAIYNNSWIPCGLPVNITNDNLILNYSIGDTHIGRFDMLRVFPNDILQIPQHTEIVSFICESFINSDGRCDVNRHNTDSSLMTPNNYGLFNNIYSQKNNYFTYNVLNPDLFNAKKFTNSIVWSKAKVSGEIIDKWTNLNIINSIDLDGVYGEVSSINLFNNDLYAFQPKGVARLLFNERVQQQASDGVSVELTNGYKVPEYRYLSNQYGASNKWSIIEGKQGVYFIDYTNRSLMSIGDGIKDLGLSLGFKSWFNENVVGRDFNLSYDRVNNDLYIHDDTDCLNYSETLGSFVSFFDYINVPQMKNVWDSFISIGYSGATDVSDVNKSTIWLHNKGDYNMFYGIQKPFSVEYLVNPEPLSDKVFNTFEYRLNDQFIDWNNLELTNWYQYGELNDRQYLNSLKRKFNVNRVQLPRQSKTLDNSTGLVMLDTRNSLNRIRSTWSKLKLSHKTTAVNINKKFDMQDLTVTYTI